MEIFKVHIKKQFFCFNLNLYLNKQKMNVTSMITRSDESSKYVFYAKLDNSKGILKCKIK